MDTRTTFLRKIRSMEDVARECRAKEQSAMRSHRVADAALYGQVAERAESLLERERELVEFEDLRFRNGRSLPRALMIAGCVIVALLVALSLTSCAAIGPTSGTLEAYGGSGIPSGRGGTDVGDAGPYGLIGVSGSGSGEKSYADVAGEWFVEGGQASGEVDAGALGLFDLDATVVRFGAGLRLGTHRALGLDWTLGLGACLTVVEGEASAGAVKRDISEGGPGAYVSGTVGRGPFFLRTTYVDGPSVDVEGEDVQLGGLSVVGGVRWTF